MKKPISFLALVEALGMPFALDPRVYRDSETGHFFTINPGCAPVLVGHTVHQTHLNYVSVMLGSGRSQEENDLVDHAIRARLEGNTRGYNLAVEKILANRLKVSLAS